MSSYGKVRKKKHRNTALQVILGIAAVIVIAAAAAYFYFSGRIGINQAYVSNWSQLLNQVKSGVSSQATISGTTTDVTGINYPIITKTRINSDVENILLIGTDGEGRHIGDRSDSMIVVSLNSEDKSVKLTSFMRDTRVYYKDKDAHDKLNAGYSYGGPGQTVNIINDNFNLDIQKYIVVDFSGFEKIVNTIGGVDIKITKKEATKIKGMKGKPAGTYHLTGKQALDYARIRKIDNDYYRTGRQRTVLLAIYKKMKTASLSEKISVANTCIGYIKTNLSATEILSLVTAYATSVSGIKQYTVPEMGNWTDKYYGSEDFVVIKDWDRQLKSMKAFIFNTGSVSSGSAS